MKTFLTLCISLVFPFGFQSFAQGCSDAGFCTVDALKNPSADSTSGRSNLLKVGLVVGKADHDITIFSSFIEYKHAFGERWSADVKLTHLSQLLDSISQHRPADVFITGGYALNDDFSLTAGIKLPFTNGNLLRNGQSLPLDFQPSLGTIDFITGVSWEHKRFRITTALQQPLTQNKNAFLASEYDSTSVLSGFQSTNGFERKGDVLLRGIYTQPLGQRWFISPGLLAIVHMGEDSFTDASGARMSIDGSSGLTLNGTLFLNYSINQRQKLELSAGSPFVVRQSRPDGLTRSIVVGLEYRLFF